VRLLDRKTEVAKYLLKGTQVFVRGTPSIDVYTTNTGSTGAKLRCKVDKITLLGSSNGNGTNNTQAPNQAPQPNTAGIENPDGTPTETDDLPF